MGFVAAYKLNLIAIGYKDIPINFIKLLAAVLFFLYVLLPKIAIIITVLIGIMIKFFNYFRRSALINLRPIKPIQNLSKANEECSSHFWLIFYMS